MSRRKPSSSSTRCLQTFPIEPKAALDASELFLGDLEGVTDPEAKRKAIGKRFIEVFDETARREGTGATFLVQGTLYPDVIESVSAGGPSVTIKSHHNVGGLPEDVPFELVEPLRELFKDEVRAVGRELGLLDDRARARLLEEMGDLILDG